MVEWGCRVERNVVLEGVDNGFEGGGNDWFFIVKMLM